MESSADKEGTMGILVVIKTIIGHLMAKWNSDIIEIKSFKIAESEEI